MIAYNIGIDIFKSNLDVFWLEDGATQRFGNKAAEFRALVKCLGKSMVARITFEPTGPYHKAFMPHLGIDTPWSK